MANKKSALQRRQATRQDPNREVKVVTYRRASTDEENQPYSLDAQQADIQSFLALRPNWTVVAEYVERASAKDVAGRPQLQSLLDAAGRDQFDAVLVAKVDRWSRRVSDVASTVEYLHDLGVEFVSVAEPFISTDGPFGTFMLQMLATFAEFERALII